MRLDLGRALQPVRAVLVFALTVLVVTVIALPVALAYTPATFEPDANDKPESTASITHDPATGLKQGDTFSYNGTYVLTGMQPESTADQITKITIGVDSNARFLDVFDPSFTLDSVPVSPTNGSCNDLSCTFEFTNLSDGTLEWTKQAKVAENAPTGTKIIANTGIEVTTNTFINLVNYPQEVSQTVEDDKCVGYHSGSQTLSEQGAWLAEIKFGDGNGKGWVNLAGDPTITSDPTSRNYITFQDGNGVDITEEVWANATYNPNDPSRPWFPREDYDNPYPNARWLDSLNFPFDPSTWTGNTWLPAGTTISFQRYIVYENCLPGGFSTDPDPDRPFGISTSIARPVVSISETAVDSFALPGEAKIARCLDNIWMSSSTPGGSGPTSYVQWDPLTYSETSIGSLSLQSDAIAASADYDTTIFGMRINGGEVYTLDTVTGEYKTLPITGANITANGMAFDPYGRLWLVSRGATAYYLTKQQVADALNGDPVVWNSVGLSVDLASVSYGDLAFTSDGTMWLLGSRYPNNSTPPAPLFVSASPIGETVPASISLDRLSTGLSPVTAGNPIRGLAVVMVGGVETIYLAWNTGIYEINQITGIATRVTSVDVSRSISDMASCVTPISGSGGPEFAVEKSAINADGTIAPPGGDGSAVTVGADGRVTVKYVVTVANIGTEAGTFDPIDDEYTVPSSFVIDDVLLDGDSVGTSGRFTIDPELLQPGQAKSVVVTVHAHTTDIAAETWSHEAACAEGDIRTSSGGMFNRVSMTGDTDGDENNDACVPITPQDTAKLTLIKHITDTNGDPLEQHAGDAQYFTLVAAGPTGIQGVSPSSGVPEVSSLVAPGTYFLSESPNDGGVFTGRYSFGRWTCTNALEEDVPVVGITNSIIVGVNDDITCEIDNTPHPRVHILKTPTHQAPEDQLGPEGANPHIGAVVTADPDGRVLMEYTISVINDDPFSGETGAVSEIFTVPAGLVWDTVNGEQKPATIVFDAQGTGAEAVDHVPTKEYFQEDLANGVFIASKITGLQPGPTGEVIFRVTIPLRLDTTLSETYPGTVFEQYEEQLGQCVNTSTGGAAHSDNTMGVPNVTSIYNENQEYGPIPTEDNLGCIPVKKPLERPVLIEKQGLDCDVDTPTCAMPGAQFDLYDVDPATEGATPIENGVVANPEDLSKFATVHLRNGHYWIVETQAPDGFQLLAEPIHFELTNDGVVLRSEGLVEVTGDDLLTVVISDVARGELPVTGGPGRWAFLAVGAIVLALAGAYQLQTSVRHRRE